MADALEDDFVPSDVEYDGEAAAEDHFETEANGNNIYLKKKSDNKRKKNHDDGNAEENTGSQRQGEEEAKRAQKKLKLKQKDKAKKAKRAAANQALEPGAIARYPSDMQADHLRKLMRSCKQFAKMTDMELDEIGIAERMLLDASSAIALERKGENLAKFVKDIASEAAKDVQDVAATSSIVEKDALKGRPIVIVVTGNAQRAADLARAVRPLLPATNQSDAGKTKDRLNKKSRSNSQADSDADDKERQDQEAKIAVAKLFARHFKVKEQVDFLAQHVCPVAVGTPQRLVDLLQEEALHLDLLRCIVLDASWADVKQRTLLDGIETRQALFSLLTHKSVQAALHGKDDRKKKKCAKVGLF